MKSFWSFAIFVALVAILFTLNNGLYEKTKTFVLNLWNSVEKSVDAPEFDATIAEDAEWKTFMAGPCGFSVGIPDSFVEIEKNTCSGAVGETTTVLHVAATKVCKSLVTNEEDTTSCHLHMFDVADGQLEPVGDNPTPKKMGLLKGTQTITKDEDTVTIAVVGTSSRGRSYRYTHVAPLAQEDIALDNFKKILDTFTLNN